MNALAAIVVEMDGGPWATHNMPCAVCRVRHAVINLDTGRFEPCWTCQDDGWRTVQKRRWWKRRAAVVREGTQQP